MTTTRSFLRLALSLLIVLPGLLPGFASDGIHGRVRINGQYHYANSDSLDAFLNEQHRNTLSGDSRLLWERQKGNWDISFHYLLTAITGDEVHFKNKASSFFAPAPPFSALDLTKSLVEKEHLLIEHKFDRAAVGYSTSNYVVRLGRQALTWGSGKVFQVMDLVGPFAPNTVDTEYKPGVDMLYAQWLFEDGSDLQFAAAPRPQVAGGAIQSHSSTIAMYYRHTIGELGTAWLLSHNYEYWTLGIGLSGPLQGATWNIEVVPIFKVNGKTKISMLSNIDVAVTLFKRNTSLFLEYYRNGYGITDNHLNYSAIPNALQNQMARGQVFNLSRDYVSGGMATEWTPLLNMNTNLIHNLNDTSFYATVELEYSTGDNSSLLLGTQLPFGPQATEYGGAPLANESDINFSPAKTVYLQLKYYF